MTTLTLSKIAIAHIVDIVRLEAGLTLNEFISGFFWKVGNQALC
jgi:hypothetical protein